MFSPAKIILVIALASLAISTVSGAETVGKAPKTALGDLTTEPDSTAEVALEETEEPFETSTCSCDKTSKNQSKKPSEKSTNHLVLDQIKPDQENDVASATPSEGCTKEKAEKEDVEVEAVKKEEVKKVAKKEDAKTSGEKDKKSSKKRSKRDTKDKDSKKKGKGNGKDSKTKSKGGKTRK